jgi:pyrrolysine biosynthesis protein PylD
VTRLTTNDIQHIAAQLADYDTELIQKTGCSLRGIACWAAGVQESEFEKISGDLLVGIIPLTFGQGIIDGFCDIVASIVAHIGCSTFVTQVADVAGLAESYEKNADIIMLADDDRFVAIHTRSRQVVDNSEATGTGFAAGLSLMIDGLEKKDALVIGCGPVGSAATQALVKLGSRVSIFDIHLSRSDDLASRIKQLLDTEIKIVKELDHALTEHQFIVDATPAADIIRPHHITSDTYISAPGVPLGLNEAARSKVSDRLLHDPLQIGVATMIAGAAKFHLQEG